MSPARQATTLATPRAFDSGLSSCAESARPRLTAAELWNHRVEETGENAIADAANVRGTQAERDLRVAGCDVKAERPRTSAGIGDLTGQDARASDGQWRLLVEGEAVFVVEAPWGRARRR